MKWHWLACLLLLVFFGCGDTLELANGHIKGVVWASGPLEGGVVHAYELDETGKRSTQLGEGPTAADGSFEIAVGVGRGVILLEVTGDEAEYEELATGETVALDSETVLSAALTHDGSGHVAHRRRPLWPGAGRALAAGKIHCRCVQSDLQRSSRRTSRTGHWWFRSRR